jgi:hypothetical protein
MFNDVISGKDKMRRPCVPNDSLAYNGTKQEFTTAQEITFQGFDCVMSDAFGSIIQSIAKRRLVIGEKGYIGLAPPHAEVGDVIYLLAGEMCPTSSGLSALVPLGVTHAVLSVAATSTAS